MWPPQICPSCKAALGNIYAVFSEIAKEKMKKVVEEKGTTPKQVTNDDSIRVEFSDLFDDLGLELICCRKTLSQCMLFSEHY